MCILKLKGLTYVRFTFVSLCIPLTFAPCAQAVLVESLVTGDVSVPVKASAGPIITILDYSTEVLYPQDGQIFQVPNVTDVFNLTASGKGHINYKVVTDNNPLTLYEKSLMCLDSYYLYVSDPITFAANTTTDRNWSIPFMSVTGLIGVGGHIAGSELEITYLGSTIMDVIDTHIFKVVPEPATVTLLALGSLAFLRRRRG